MVSDDQAVSLITESPLHNRESKSIKSYVKCKTCSCCCCCTWVLLLIGALVAILVLKVCGFGTVFLASDAEREREEGHRVALKVVEGTGLKALRTEVGVLLTLEALGDGCTHIPRVLGSCLRDRQDWGYVVLPLCGDPIFDTRRVDCTISTKTAAVVLRDVTRALSHIHSLGFLHRDINPRNILYSKWSTSSVTLVDFGLATTTQSQRRDTADGTNHAFCGTRRHAPIAAHLNHPRTELDDLESLLFTICDALGCLPWERGVEREAVIAAKMRLVPEGDDKVRDYSTLCTQGTGLIKDCCLVLEQAYNSKTTDYNKVYEKLLDLAEGVLGEAKESVAPERERERPGVTPMAARQLGMTDLEIPARRVTSKPPKESVISASNNPLAALGYDMGALLDAEMGKKGEVTDKGGASGIEGLEGLEGLESMLSKGAKGGREGEGEGERKKNSVRVDLAMFGVHQDVDFISV
ncbi:hypothetical protein KIPB_002853 [Kipferlia bialata]|uniref:Protein kinase domain-containing protein n=1 Tax=Kipferlia bialata TaxID=797122 RepID=A0A9K3CRB9_9EUKA|nr:hypothetical protein KIPB_002853 [Kipferlia bialata]|eukprot:g2853.t1